MALPHKRKHVHTDSHTREEGEEKAYLYRLKVIRNNKLFRDLFNQDDIIKKKSLDKASQSYLRATHKYVNVQWAHTYTLFEREDIEF